MMTIGWKLFQVLSHFENLLHNNVIQILIEESHFSSGRENMWTFYFYLVSIELICYIL